MISSEASLNLDQLRGLHLPQNSTGLLNGEIAAAMMFGLLAAFLVGLVRHLKRRAQRTIRRAALHELTITRSLEPEDRLVAQAYLLRRLARTLNGDDSVHKRGLSWSTELDELFGTSFFTTGAGYVFANGLYQQETPDLDAIDVHLHRLFQKIRR